MGERHVTFVRLSFTLTVITGIAFLASKVRAPDPEMGTGDRVVDLWGAAVRAFGQSGSDPIWRNGGPSCEPPAPCSATCRRLPCTPTRTTDSSCSCRIGPALREVRWSRRSWRLRWSATGFALQFSCAGQGACPPIEYLFDRRPIGEAEVEPLCGRLAESEILLSSGADQARTSRRVNWEGPAECAAWLGQQGFVTAVAGVTTE